MNFKVWKANQYMNIDLNININIYIYVCVFCLISTTLKPAASCISCAQKKGRVFMVVRIFMISGAAFHFHVWLGSFHFHVIGTASVRVQTDVEYVTLCQQGS